MRMKDGVEEMAKKGFRQLDGSELNMETTSKLNSKAENLSNSKHDLTQNEFDDNDDEISQSIVSKIEE